MVELVCLHIFLDFFIFQHSEFDAKMRSNILTLMQGAFQTFEIASKIENCGSAKRVLPNARLLPGVADQKLGSRMDAPIFVFGSTCENHQTGTGFIR